MFRALVLVATYRHMGAEVSAGPAERVLCRLLT
jgi:hypothetical protein